MCGVGAVYTPAPRMLSDRDEGVLGRLGDSMERRGPDARGAYRTDRVGITHTRLSILDLDQRANQPMESEDWVLSFNGEIYNFRSLRQELERSYTFRTTSDTESLLLALQQWGLEKALAKCAGMFAFLAYHKKQQVLYAVRDRLGIKPLFFTRLHDGTSCFASSPAAIVKALPDLDWKEYRPAIASYFVLGAPFTTMSVIDGIQRIEPAHYVRLTPDGMITQTRYWEPEFQEGFTMDDLAGIVREHQVSDVKSALFLSGGVDSSFLASILDGLDCFHLTSPETKYARAVAKKYQRPFVQVEPELDEYVEGIRQVCMSHGEPYMSCGIPNAVSTAIADQGYKMAVIANGADELFHGYPRTPSPEWTPEWLPLHEEKTYRWFFEQLSHIFRDNRNFDLEQYEDVLPSLGEIGRNAMENYHLAGFPPSASHRWFELMTYVLHDLNATLDAASMANSIEVRVPFLDHRIVQGVLSWSAEELVTRKCGRKTPLKRWLSRDFPRSFFNRPKLGFSIDESALKAISSVGRKTFNAMRKDGFITIKENKRLGHFDRDMIYLEQCCLVFSLWKSCRFTGCG